MSGFCILQIGLEEYMKKLDADQDGQVFRSDFVKVARSGLFSNAQELGTKEHELSPCPIQ